MSKVPLHSIKEPPTSPRKVSLHPALPRPSRKTTPGEEGAPPIPLIPPRKSVNVNKQDATTSAPNLARNKRISPKKLPPTPTGEAEVGVVAPSKKPVLSSTSSLKKVAPQPTTLPSQPQLPSHDWMALPNISEWGDAPEIAHLIMFKSKQKKGQGSLNVLSLRPVPSDKGESKETIVDLQSLTEPAEGGGDEGNKSKPKRSCLQKLCCGKCCQPEFDDLDDLDPVTPRARHSIKFVQVLADEKMGIVDKRKSAAKLRTSVSSSSVVSASKATDPDQLVKGKAYRSMYNGLLLLQDVHNLIKQLILYLTFTRYAEGPLTQKECDLSHCRTVIGSYMWLLTYVLEQEQFDSEVAYSGYPSKDVADILNCFERVVGNSVIIWREMVNIVEAVEKVHDTVHKVFTALLHEFTHESDKEFRETRHIRVFSNYQKRAEELEKLKNFEGKTHQTHQTWAKFNATPLRILYKQMGSEDWRSYDLLTQDRKFAVLKCMVLDVEKMGLAIINHLGSVMKGIQEESEDTPSVAEQVSSTNSGHHRGPAYRDSQTPSDQVSLSSVKLGARAISFLDGVIHMKKKFEKLPKKIWANQEIKEFIEVEKIVVDNLDLLTLGAATLRSLLHDARHITHVCYELCRELDYAECQELPIYEDIAANVMDNEAIEKMSVFQKKKMSTASNVRAANSAKMKRHLSMASDYGSPDALSSFRSRKKRIATFDVEEKNLEHHDVETQFDRSIYQDIIKELPLRTNNLALALTLQDTEAVFTNSSQSLLSTDKI